MATIIEQKANEMSMLTPHCYRLLGFWWVFYSCCYFVAFIHESYQLWLLAVPLTFFLLCDRLMRPAYHWLQGLKLTYVIKATAWLLLSFLASSLLHLFAGPMGLVSYAEGSSVAFSKERFFLVLFDTLIFLFWSLLYHLACWQRRLKNNQRLSESPTVLQFIYWVPVFIIWMAIVPPSFYLTAWAFVWVACVSISSLVVSHYIFRPLYQYFSHSQFSMVSKRILAISVVVLCATIIIQYSNDVALIVCLYFNWPAFSGEASFLMYAIFCQVVFLIIWFALYQSWLYMINEERDHQGDYGLYIFSTGFHCFFWFITFLLLFSFALVDMDALFMWDYIWNIGLTISSLFCSYYFLRPFCFYLLRSSSPNWFKWVLSLIVIITCTWLVFEFNYQICASIAHFYGLTFYEGGNRILLALEPIQWLFFLTWLGLCCGQYILQQNQQSYIKALQAEKSLQEVQLKALKNQLNPHFIFNTLNSLRFMIIKDAGIANNMITELSSLLRYSLYSGTQKNTVSLQQELDHLKGYLGIELLRFESRIELRWDIDEHLLDAAVMPLCLQSLVENAIKHAINDFSDGIFIEISAKLYGDDIHLIVANRGVLKRRENKEGGVGLHNNRRRLAILFGNRASLSLMQTSKEVVTAKVVHSLILLDALEE